MGLKENFMQAARELLGAPTPKLALEPSVPMDMEPSSTASRIKAANPFSRREEYFPPEEPVSSTLIPEPTPVPPPAPAPAPAVSVSPPVYRDAPISQKETITTIAAGTVIQGSVRSAASMDLFGEVYGDVATKENLKLSGRLEGNASGQDIEIINGRIKGDIIATGRVSINNNSIVLGNIRAETLLLNGKVKGNLEIKGSLALDVNAAVAGSVLAGKLSIAEGAILQGDVRISTTDLNKLFAEGEAAGKRPTEESAPSLMRKPGEEAPRTAPIPPTMRKPVMPSMEDTSTTE